MIAGRENGVAQFNSTLGVVFQFCDRVGEHYIGNVIVFMVVHIRNKITSFLKEMETKDT